MKSPKQQAKVPSYSLKSSRKSSYKHRITSKYNTNPYASTKTKSKSKKYIKVYN